MPLIVKGNGTVEVRGKNSCRVEFQVENTATGKIERMRQTMSIKSNTKQERERCRREYRAQIESGQRQDTRGLTVRQFSEDWLSHRRSSSDVRESTIRKDVARLNAINMHLGDMKLIDLDVQTIEGFYTSLLNGNSPSGKKLSGTYANGISVTLKQMLAEAVRYDIITRNPAEYAKRPKKDTDEVVPLSIAEMVRMKKVLDAEAPRASRVGFYLALFAGLRRGEVCGLSWSDINLESDRPTLTVLHSRDSKTCELGEPKTPSSKRTVPLMCGLADYLGAWKAHQGWVLANLGVLQEGYPVACTPGAEYMHPENLSRSWGRFATRFGFGGVNLHGLRHSFCTFLCVNGVELQYAQYLMGHADVQTTANIYTHCTDDMKEKAGQALQEAAAKLPIVSEIEMAVSNDKWGVPTATLENALPPDFPQIKGSDEKSVPTFAS